MRWNKYKPLIILLCISLLLTIFVHMLLHVRIYIVYSLGLGPLLIMVVFALVIVTLYLKG
ncbi:hypothetical protein [Metabacillus iocasae]|uniref:Cytochrome c oxidase subunit IV n=1 Tax=Priestia iocasae TaxID=2291674 RepID=A0ABS2QXL9_9BACI|nr:hypothetical protein [Metabacillus iocasae]MBM7703486.1 cytochrome c oxidase subunit IV [Metabacillus iocasae]